MKIEPALPLDEATLAELVSLCRFFHVRRPGALVEQDVKPVIQAFIREGDVERRSDIFGMTLLHLACQRLLPHLVAELLRHGAEVNAERPCWQPAVPDGTSLPAEVPLSLALGAADSPFAEDVEAAFARGCRVAQLLLAAGADARYCYSADAQERAGKSVVSCLRPRTERLRLWLAEQGLMA